MRWLAARCAGVLRDGWRHVVDLAETLDFRLLPAALCLWLAAAIGLLFDWWLAVVCGVAGAVLGALIMRRRPGARTTGAALTCCGLLAAVVLGVRLHRVEAHPLRALAATGARAELRVELTDRPKPVYSTGFGGQQSGISSLLIPANVLLARVNGSNVVAADASVLLIASPTGWANVLPGQQLTVSGALAPADGGMTVATLRVRGPPEQPTAAPTWQRVSESLRAGLRRASSVLSPAPAGLLPGLVDGDTSAEPHELVEDFRATGLTHLTAVSGENLAILSGAVLLLLRVLRVGPRVSAVGAGLALTGFVVLVGPQPSVFRAAVMGFVGLLALALGRPRTVLPSLSFAVIVLISYDPGFAVDAGFVLSVLATAALVLLAPRLAESMVGRRVPVGIAQALAIPAAATLATAPVIAGISGQVSLVTVVTNVLVAPVIAPATVFGVLAAACSPLWSGGAAVAARLAGPEVSWLVEVAHVGARIPGATMSWPAGFVGAVLLAGLIGVLVLCLRVRRLRVLALTAVVVLVALSIPVRVISPGWPPTGWAMVDCDVGQGDAEVLATDQPGRAVVVDTGPDDAVDGCLRRLGITQIPLVVLSHLHADHIGGLTSVLQGRSVGAVAVGASRVPDWAWQDVAREARAARVPLVQLAVGEQLRWPGLTVDVLGPQPAEARPPPGATDGTSINNTSIVLRANTAAGKVLLSGDVELAAQADLLDAHVDLTADVLKIPHHGSRYSVPAFLDAVHAHVAVASVGAGNPYGHPSQVTLDRLRSDGAMVLRTDQDGDVAVINDGNGLQVVRRGDPRPPPH
ncbi:MAG: ComEC/Rec2 family competence protein [Sciscionella sp.]|nr:ComEC/Rec2 family competence protein [Sciscionella sp.]